MESFTPNRELSHYQMEMLLPDYVLGKLNPDEMTLFESNLPRYPDLAGEVAEARIVFGKIDKMDLDSKNAYRSRNVSVKVQDNLGHRLKRQQKFRFVARFILPTAALIFMAILVIDSPRFDKSSNNPELAFAAYRMPAIFDPDELYQLFDSEYEENYDLLGDAFDREFDKLELSGAGQDYISTGIISDYYYYDVDESGNYYPLNSINFETKDLDKLDEEIFQQILEEIENVDINS